MPRVKRQVASDEEDVVRKTKKVKGAKTKDQVKNGKGENGKTERKTKSEKTKNASKAAVADSEAADSEAADSDAAGNDEPETKTFGNGQDAEGNPYWEFGRMRRINTSEFKGRKLINIREYWSDSSGDLKPSKKGISLSVEQFQDILNFIPEIVEALRYQGEKIQYGTEAAHTPDVEPEKAKKAKKVKKEKKDQASDEEE